MRETKFRGKRIDNGEWIYGFYGELTDGYSTKSYIIASSLTFNPSKSIYFTDNEVDPKSVGEYTYNQDKNSNEIYEGMSIRFKLPKTPYWAEERNQNPIGVVEYNPEKGGFVVVFREHGVRQHYVYFDCDIACECEIVED